MNLKKIIIGYLLITYGILGELLPILEGLVFITIGLLLLKDDVKWAHRLLFEWTEDRSLLRQAVTYLSDKVDHISETIGLSNKGKK